MKIATTAVFITLIIVPLAKAAEPEDRMAANDHVLGRVFMSSVERRQLDLLRKSPPPAQSGPQRSVSQPADANQKKKPMPAGYIVPSNGRPYQWIEGDFRHVTQSEVDTSNISPSISITRHDISSANSDRSAAPPEAVISQQDQKLDVEADDENRRQQ